jgi:hypothetical protein
MGGELALKLPFTLMHSTSTMELTESLSLSPPPSHPSKEASPSAENKKKANTGEDEDVILKCDEEPT